MELAMSAPGVLGFILGMVALVRIKKLEKQLNDIGVLDKEFDRGFDEHPEIGGVLALERGLEIPHSCVAVLVCLGQVR